jgi:hypothetical protein
MSKDVTLAGKIDAEHCSRQNLCHGAFRDDLLFLCHSFGEYTNQRTSLKVTYT